MSLLTETKCRVMQAANFSQVFDNFSLNIYNDILRGL